MVNKQHFEGALISKVNHSRRLEVTDQGEILASQDFDHGSRSTYNICVCNNLDLLALRFFDESKLCSSKLIYLYRFEARYYFNKRFVDFL